MANAATQGTLGLGSLASIPAPIYPDAGELHGFWAACSPVTEVAAVAAALKARSIDPAVVVRCDLARALTSRVTCPHWAHTAPKEGKAGRSWWVLGVRLVVPLVDHTGRVVSVLGRLLADGALTADGERKQIKSVVPYGMSAAGLAFASVPDREWLSRMDEARMDTALALPRPPAAFVMVEGEMDYLTWATRLLSRVPSPPPLDGTPLTPRPGHALLLGLRSGSFSPTWAQALRGRLPAQATPPAILRLHHDAAGNHYALSVGTALRCEGVMDVQRTIPHARPTNGTPSDGPFVEGDDLSIDENEAAQLGILPDDFTTGALSFAHSLTNALSIDPARRDQVLTEADMEALHRLRAQASGLMDRAKTSTEIEDLLAQRQAYFRAACDNAVAEVASSGKGEHNNTLFKQAVALTRFKFEPDLDMSRSTLDDVFRATARAIGHTEARILSTLDSAWRTTHATRRSAALPDRLSLDDDVRREARALAAATRAQTRPARVAGGGGPARPAHSRRDTSLDTAEMPALDLDPASFDVGSLDRAALGAEPTEAERHVYSAPTPYQVGGAVEVGGRVYVDVGGTSSEPEVDACWRMLSMDGATYVRDGELVEVLPASNDLSARVRPLPQEQIDARLSNIGVFYRDKMDKKTGEMKRDFVRPPTRCSKALFTSRTPRYVRGLSHLLTHPSFINGRVVWREGYDAATCAVLLHSAPVAEMTPPAAPTKEQALAALEVLKSPFVDFHFDHAGGLAAALSLILTLLARPSMDEFVPYYLVTSTTPGTGKGTLVSAIHALVTGERSLGTAEMRAGEEQMKQFVGWQRAGLSGIMYFDNLKSGSSIGTPLLDSVLTSGVIMGRVLGTNDMIQGRLWVTFVGTGNNVSVSGDMARRTVPLPLICPRGTTPKTRTWQHPNLITHILSRRGELLRAALTILAAYHAAGCPLTGTPAGPRELASFASWSKWCRDPLVWLGMPDFIQTGEESVAQADVTLLHMEELMRTLFVLLKSQSFSLASLQQTWRLAVDQEDAISMAFVAACEELDFSDGKRWSKAAATAILSAYQGRILGEYKLAIERPFMRWRIEKI